MKEIRSDVERKDGNKFRVAWSALYTLVTLSLDVYLRLSIFTDVVFIIDLYHIAANGS